MLVLFEQTKNILMAFDGTEGGEITLAEARSFTANYDVNLPAGTAEAHYFGRNIIERLLAQQGCVGIRMYYGKESDGRKNLVLVGVEASEDDMIDGIIADRSIVCPPICAPKKKLKS
jgi:hypothetical protein